MYMYPSSFDVAYKNPAFHSIRRFFQARVLFTHDIHLVICSPPDQSVLTKTTQSAPPFQQTADASH